MIGLFQLQIQSRFLRKIAIYSDSSKCIAKKVDKHYSFLIDRFNQRSVSQNNFVSMAHQHILHVLFQFDYKLDTFHKQVLKRRLAYKTSLCFLYRTHVVLCGVFRSRQHKQLADLTDARVQNYQKSIV